jgi:excisionase family DNA binding protein
MTLNQTNTYQSKAELFNNTEAAAYIGVTPGTLEVWRSTKRYNLPFIKVGRLVKYRKESLDAFLESRTVGEEV